MIKIMIDTSGPAFETDPRGELARILTDLARGLRSRTGKIQDLQLKDIDGGRVGYLSEEPPVM